MWIMEPRTILFWLLQLLCMSDPPFALAFPHHIRHIYHAKNHKLHQHHAVNFQDSWSVITLGDLHMEDDMTSHLQARQDCIQAMRDFPILGRKISGNDNDDGSKNRLVPLTHEYLQRLEQSPAGDLTVEELQLLLNRRQQQQQQQDSNAEFCHTYMVSLGDLGRGDKESRHKPGDAGTSQSFQDAKAYLDGFAGIPYDLVTGNHDLEALDEFETDHDNLQAWMNCFHKPHPQFHRYIGEKTLLLGLSTVQFRDAPYSSHEVHVDDSQIAWFQKMVESHPDQDGWKILVFSHAPIMGSGLRVLQNVHLTSGCAWLNHCSSASRNKFIHIVQQNPQIKCWASGHFHLSHECQDSLVQTQVGSCTFVQVGVIGPKSTRDGRRQTRFFRGCGDECIEIYSINHHVRIPKTATTSGSNGDVVHLNDDSETKAEVRLDATIDLKTGRLIHAPKKVPIESDASSTMTNKKGQEWFQAYVPQEEDGCYLEDVDGSLGDASSDKVCWWHMADGKVLGLHRGQLVEYDAETLAPLGVVVLEDQLKNREVLIVQNKTTLVLAAPLDNDNDNGRNTPVDIEVVHPNADGSYWRKLSKSKVLRLEEKAREEVAKQWIEQKQRQQQVEQQKQVENV